MTLIMSYIWQNGQFYRPVVRFYLWCKVFKKSQFARREMLYIR